MNPIDKALLGIIVFVSIVGVVGNIVIYLQNRKAKRQ
jgi:hypothetical protein